MLLCRYWSLFLFCLISPVLATEGKIRDGNGFAACSRQIRNLKDSTNAVSLFVKAQLDLARGRVLEAEECFRQVARIDSNDWEAHEQLALLYQWQGDKEKRDLELRRLRDMYRKGVHWRDYILRDQFVLKGWRILSAELLHGDGNGDRKYLLSVHDAGNGRFLHMVSLTRTRESQWAPSRSDPFHPEKVEGYRYTLHCESKSKRFFLDPTAPKDSEIRRILTNFLESL